MAIRPFSGEPIERKPIPKTKEPVKEVDPDAVK
jgi:hypothetical protein